MSRGLALALVAAATLVGAAPASAYHTGSTYDRAPGAGGAGGLFHTGSVRERGWTCRACHTDTPDRLRVSVTSQPPELVAEGRFAAGAVYSITIAMLDPTSQLGQSSARSNFNGMAISFLDDTGAGAGTIGGFTAGRFYARGTSILASDSPMVNETSWTFTWTAPGPGALGPITIDVGVVDGNGADAMGASTLTDPDGDDVWMQSFVVHDAASARQSPLSPPSSAPVALVPLLAVLTLIAGRSRRPSRSPRTPRPRG